MVLVVVLHVLGQGGVLAAVESVALKDQAMWFLETAAFCATDCFALISGYVGVTSKYRYSNIVLMWLRVAYYSVSIALIAKFVLPEYYSWSDVALSFFPVTTNQYWYFSAYFILFLFIPILNLAFVKLSKKQLNLILWILIILLSVIFPILGAAGDVFGIKRGHSPLWLMVLYLVGGYIRKYGFFEKTKSSVVLAVFFGSVLLAWLSRSVIIGIPFIKNMLSTSLGNESPADMWISDISIFILCAAIALLLLFKRIRIRGGAKKVIFFISQLVFSVYLIHTNHKIFGQLMKDAFTWIADFPVFGMIPIVLGCSLAIFAVCILIDLIRHYLFVLLKLKKRLSALEQKIIAKLSAKNTD